MRTRHASILSDGFVGGIWADFSAVCAHAVASIILGLLSGRGKKFTSFREIYFYYYYC